MTPILQNLAEMTGQRDHLRLEVSVLSTLVQLSTTVQVRALELFTHDDQLLLRPRSWSEGRRIVSSEIDALHDPLRQPVASIPELAQCLAQRQRHAQRNQRGNHVLWMPLWLGEQALTCLEITQSRPFSRHQRDILLGVFQVYQNYQNLLDYSERDALTGLLNRKTFEDQFSLAGALRPTPSAPHHSGATDEDTPRQWLAVIDIDYFKQVNDRYGHLFGDEVLILVANRLRTLFRSQDRIFRFGGEEFVVLLRQVTLTQARQAFERLRAAIAAHSFPQIGHITVSIGFVAATQGLPVEVLGRADQALYHAKETGRDQVCYYDDLIANGDLQEKIANDEIELF